MLEQKAKEIRRKVLDIIYHTKHGHIGGSFSCIDILVALYYQNLTDEKFILSKGHACLPLYVILEDKGIIPEGSCDKFCQDGALLGGHPDISIPGIVCESGSLGHGLGIAAGMALAGQKVIVLIGDGELYEGSVWEAMLFIAHHELDVTLIIDRNQQVVCNFTEDINKLDPLIYKLNSFRWYMARISKYNFEDIEWAFGESYKKPFCIIADTVKGKGVSFMEKELRWHHSIPTEEEYELAVKELNG